VPKDVAVPHGELEQVVVDRRSAGLEDGDLDWFEVSLLFPLDVGLTGWEGEGGEGGVDNLARRVFGFECNHYGFSLILYIYVVNRVFFDGYWVGRHAVWVSAACSFRDAVFVALIMALPAVTGLKVPVKSVGVQVMLCSILYNARIDKWLFVIIGH
jgi:hypothetical protein